MTHSNHSSSRSEVHTRLNTARPSDRRRFRSGTFDSIRMGTAAFATVLAIATAVSSSVIPTHAETALTLKNSFIEKYKDRATIEATLLVDKAAPIHSAKDDGDMHVAGRSTPVGLPLVAEVMNARAQPEAVSVLRAAQGNTTGVHVSGAWRIWCEHSGDSIQIQGAPITPATSTNPDHVFEIHPLTSVDQQDLRGSFTSIEGYTYKTARKAFERYESLPSQIIREPNARTTIITGAAGYNYVAFNMSLDEAPSHTLTDGGLSVFASVLDEDDEPIVDHRRMIFVSGTEPEQRVRQMHEGETLRVLGIPRLDLAVVSWRIRNAPVRPEILRWSLPYEILVVAVLE